MRQATGGAQLSRREIQRISRRKGERDLHIKGGRRANENTVEKTRQPDIDSSAGLLG